MAKQDALAAQAVADGTLYDAGFADGVASVAPSAPGFTQADINAAVAAARAADLAAVSATVAKDSAQLATDVAADLAPPASS